MAVILSSSCSVPFAPTRLQNGGEKSGRKFTLWENGKYIKLFKRVTVCTT